MTTWFGQRPLCTSDHPSGHDPGCAARNRRVDGQPDRRADRLSWPRPSWVNQQDRTATAEEEP